MAIGKNEERRAIVIAKEPLSKYMLVIMLEFQKFHDATLHVTDPYINTMEQLVRLLINAGFCKENGRDKVTTTNVATGDKIHVTEVRVEKIGAAQTW